MLTKTLLFLGEGSDAVIGTVPGGSSDYHDASAGFGESWRWGKKFCAYDKATGEVLMEMELPAGTTAAPLSYLHEGNQYIVIGVSSLQAEPEWVALALEKN